MSKVIELASYEKAVSQGWRLCPETVEAARYGVLPIASPELGAT